MANHHDAYGRLPRGVAGAGLFVCLLSCQSPAIPQASSFQLERPFILSLGETGVSDELGLTVRFLEVSGDSRCRAGTVCIWAGYAEVSLEITRSSRTTGHTLLTPNGLVCCDRDTLDGLEIRLLELHSRDRVGAPPVGHDVTLILHGLTGG